MNHDANFSSSNFVSGAFVKTTTGYVNVLFIRSLTAADPQTTITLDDGSTHTADVLIDALASALGVAGALMPLPPVAGQLSQQQSFDHLKQRIAEAQATAAGLIPQPTPHGL